MRNRFIVVVLGLSVFLAFASHEWADAACFAGPDADAVFAAVDDDEAQWVRKQVPPELPFRGRLGRIDRTIVSSDWSKTIRVGADPVCRSRPLALAAAASAKETENGLVAIIAWRDMSGALLRAKVYSTNCNQLLAGVPVDSTRVSCAASGPKVVESGGARLVELPLDPRTVKGSRMERVSVVVVGRVDLAKARRAIVAVAEDGDTCARVAKTSRNFATDLDGYICVDKIFRDHGYGKSCDSEQESWPVNAQDIDPTKCEVIEIPDPNEFGENCTVDESSEEPRCEGRAGTIRVEQTSCGMLIVPFDYASIMKDGNKPRYLRGVTPMSRESAPSSGAIVLPGGEAGVEFLGSMPVLDGDGKNFRKTDIATDASQGAGVLHITGSVDAVKSAVLLFPRLLVSVVCGADDGDSSNDEACQCFYSTGEGQSDKTMVGCVDTRQKDKALKCRKLVDAAGKCHEKQALTEVGYYACEAKTAGAIYDKTGLPCTRPEHCGAYGKCTASAVCVPKNSAVWRPGWTPPDDAKRCTTDDHTSTGCADTHQCGLSLFNFTGRNEIAFDLPATGDGGAHAGLCRDAQGQDCDSDDDCPDGDACIGYRLSAGKHK